MRIVSVPDRLVRDPATRRPVDDTGIDVDPTDVYWARLLADGDVAEAPPLAAEADPDTNVTTPRRSAPASKEA